MEIEMTDAIFAPRLRMLYGITMIVLGIVLVIITYQYMIQIGSIFLIGSGLTLIFWRRWNRMVRSIVLRNINKETK
jgi:hypothetical protein